MMRKPRRKVAHQRQATHKRRLKHKKHQIKKNEIAAGITVNRDGVPSGGAEAL